MRDVDIRSTLVPEGDGKSTDPTEHYAFTASRPLSLSIARASSGDAMS
jgi:hypothetical protein